MGKLAKSKMAEGFQLGYALAILMIVGGVTPKGYSQGGYATYKFFLLYNFAQSFCTFVTRARYGNSNTNPKPNRKSWVLVQG